MALGHHDGPLALDELKFELPNRRWMWFEAYDKPLRLRYYLMVRTDIWRINTECLRDAGEMSFSGRKRREVVDLEGATLSRDGSVLSLWISNARQPLATVMWSPLEKVAWVDIGEARFALRPRNR